MPEPRIELWTALQQHNMLPVGYVATLVGWFATLDWFKHGPLYIFPNILWVKPFKKSTSKNIGRIFFRKLRLQNRVFPLEWPRPPMKVREVLWAFSSCLVLSSQCPALEGWRGSVQCWNAPMPIFTKTRFIFGINLSKVWFGYGLWSREEGVRGDRTSISPYPLLPL